ncbi:MAG TPA: hypothetical protein PLK06_02700 [bacterium]|nr:hypothetical protein [bacterium]
MKKVFALFTVFALLGYSTPQFVQAAAGPGDLIMSKDFPTVYVFGEDGMRHPFPNEATYFSWFESFDDIKVISAEDLASLPLGDTVVVQPGTSLLKIPSDPTVYVVEPGGELRALSSEDQAVALFGDDWSERVVDLPEGFFPDYVRGGVLEDGEIPHGLVLRTDANELFRVDDSGAAEQIDGLVAGLLGVTLADFALDFEELELELEVEIHKVHAEDLDEIETEHLREGLQTIDVADEDEDHDLNEIELELADTEEAEDEIHESEDELNDALETVAELELEGVDVTERQALIDQAMVLLAEAQVALAEGDAETADDLAKQAGDLLHDAARSENSGPGSTDEETNDTSESSDDVADDDLDSGDDVNGSNSGSESDDSGDSESHSGSDSESDSSDNSSDSSDSSGHGGSDD